MKSSTRSIILTTIILLLFAFVAGACLPRSNPPPPPPPPPGVELTLTVQAIQLEWLTQTAQAQQAQPVVIVVTATPDPNNPAPAVDPNSAATATSGAVTVTVTQNTNCRMGPSQEFKDVGALTPGQVAEVVGRDSLDNYWIIKLPDGSGKTCWLWGQYATVNGDASTVAEVPTPTTTGPSGAPNAPTLVDAQLKCTNLSGGNYQYKITLKWADNSSNENKFTIYSSAGNVFSTPPNKTSFSFEENLPGGTNLSATLVAANEKGESQPVGTGSFQCP